MIRLARIVVMMVLVGLALPALAADQVPLGPLDRVLGKDDAPVTIIEYASLTCPHCAHFHETSLASIKTDWIDTGKVKLIYRDFPTGPVNLAVAGAMITQCAAKDIYFPLVGLLFKSQQRWATADHPLDEIKRIVGLAGLTPGQVDACLARADLGKAIQDRAAEGQSRYNIESTPSLVIAGKVVEGAQPYDDIKKLLEAAYQANTKK